MNASCDRIGRREFVAACACLATAPLLAACASMATRRVPLAGDRVRLALAEHPELARPGGAIRILPDGAADPLLVLALDGGGYAVLSTRCTHRGCTVDVQGARLVCPCHGSTYDREGAVLRGPAERPLPRHPVTVEGGMITIRLADA